MDPWRRPSAQDVMETPRNRRTWPTYPDIALEYGHAMPDALGTGQDNMSNLSWADEFVIEGQWNDRDQDMRLWSNEDLNSELQRTYDSAAPSAHTIHMETYHTNVDVDLYPNTYATSLGSALQPRPGPIPSQGSRLSQRSRQTNQTPNQPVSTAAISYPQIGAVYCTGGTRKYLFECNYPNCGKTFQRSYELERHYTGLHAPESEKEAFWCPQEGCNRSEAAARSPFFRKDKMRDHLRNFHRIDVRRR